MILRINRRSGDASVETEVLCLPSWSVFALCLGLTACGGGGSDGGAGSNGNNASAPVPTTAVISTLTADAAAAAPDGRAVTLTAVVTGSNALPFWTLEGPGSLSVTSGLSVQYVPPDSELFNDAATVKVTVSTGSSAKTFVIALDRVPGGGQRWTVVRPGSMNWRSVAAGGGGFVAVGGQDVWTSDMTGVRHDRRVLYQSSNGRDWTPRVTTGADWLVSAVYGPDGWMAITSLGEVLSSADGAAWSESGRVSGSGALFGVSQLLYGNGIYAALGTSGAYVSSDGKAWTHAVFSDPRWTFAFGNGSFVATQGFTNAGAIARSLDGLNWSVGDPYKPFSNLDAIAFGNGTFVASSGSLFAHSPDGLTWSAPENASNDLSGSKLGFARDLFFAYGKRTSPLDPSEIDWYWTSSNGIQWESNVVGNNVRPLTGVAANNDVYVRVSSMGSIEMSKDARGPWSEVVEGSVGALQAVDYFNGRYIAVSDHGWRMTSSDGATWQRRMLTAGIPVLPMDARAISHSAAKAVVCGGRETSSARAVAFIATSDGDNWTEVNAPALAGTCTAIVHDGSRFLATTDGGALLSSAEGSNWTVLSNLPGGPKLRAVAQGAGGYVVVGENGYAAFSKDGVSWTLSVPISISTDGAGHPLQNDMLSLAYDGRQFIAVGMSAVRSVDGVNWSSLPVDTNGQNRAIRYASGRYVIVDNQGNAASSRDGAKWYRRATGTGLGLYGLVEVNGKFLAVGQNSVITASEP